MLAAAAVLHVPDVVPDRASGQEPLAVDTRHPGLIALPIVATTMLLVALRMLLKLLTQVQ